MEPGFRASMGWAHTWAGVVVGALLFAIFWMGTLSVFDREIDRWMAPMTRVALPDKPLSFDELRSTYDTAVALRSPTWSLVQATERQPFIRINYRDKSGVVNRSFDPSTGAGAAGTRHMGRQSLSVSISLRAAPEDLEHRRVDRRIRRHGHVAAVRVRRRHSPQDIRRFLYPAGTEKVAAPGARYSYGVGRAGAAVQFRDHAVRPDHFLRGLFSERMAGRLFRQGNLSIPMVPAAMPGRRPTSRAASRRWIRWSTRRASCGTEASHGPSSSGIQATRRPS